MCVFVCVCARKPCEFDLTVLVLCVVMGYVLHFGETAHRS